jgi:phenylacetate-CoA ligase
MARSRKTKRRKGKAGPGARVNTRAAPARKTAAPRGPIADSGTVWPPMYPLHNSVHLALQFTFQVTEWWSPEQLLAGQMRQASALVRHAAATVPYYRDKLGEQPFSRHVPLTWDDFRALPLLRRDDIQDAGQSLVSEAIPGSHGPGYEVRSSGSTGKPIRVMGTGLTGMFLRAFSMRGHLWHGRDLAAKNVDIRTAKPTEGPRGKQTWNSVLGAGESVLLDINLPVQSLLDHLIREDPVYLQTHPYTLKGMIKNSIERGVRPQSLREARTFGEALDPGIRELARDHWGIAVVDNYSAMETGTIALQCPQNENLHVQSESVLVEVIDDYGRPCLPGEVGRVVVTSLHNFATPLIRYELGDFAEVGDACVCGRGLPVLKRVLGRQRNLLVLPSGEKRFPEAWATLTDIAPEIRQFQLIQKSLEQIEVKLVVASPLTGTQESRLTRYLVEKFDHPFTCRFVYVDDIPRGANGKFEEFMSQV